MKPFNKNRKYIENEFEEASFDAVTGLSAEELYTKLSEMQEKSGDLERERFCAEAYAFLLEKLQLEINEHTPFAVKFNIGVDYSGFAGIDVFDSAIFRKQREKVLSEKLPEDYARMVDGDITGLSLIYTDFWHTVPGWDYIIPLGFSGVLENAKASRKKHENDGDARAVRFLDSVIIRYEAILGCMRRIYEYSLSFDVPEFSEAIKNLTIAPPKSLYEVMLFSVLFLYFEEIGCERGRTLGPIDSLYYPFYKSALDGGASLEEIKEMFRYFFIHFTATKRFAQQPFLICGSDVLGNDRTNELSHLILDVYDELNILDPKIHLRYHKNIDPEIFKKALSMIRRGNSSICIVNDEAVFRGYEKLGIPREDSQNYVLLGCYEPVIMGLEEAEVGVAWINSAKSIEYLLTGGRDILSGKYLGLKTDKSYATFDELFDGYLRQLDYTVDFAIEFAEKQSKYNVLMNPSPIYSSTFANCIEKGRDVHEYSLKYNNFSLKCFGLATVVDSLCAIKKFVYENGEISLEELTGALEKNWSGYEDLRIKILNDKDKYGNGRALPDNIMQRITEHLEEKYVGKEFSYGRRLRFGLDSIDTHLYRGRVTAATPDGRLAGEVVSRNLCATPGMDRAGITGYMQSVLKINSEAFLNSAIFDFTMHPSAIEGEKGLIDFVSLIKIFFDGGGFAVQGNIVNSETLKAAQNDPRAYSTLQIRVCGWNEYFVRMSKAKQDYFIKESELK
ncbi:MAG: hypothetical protein IJX92_00025 [Clostridia bacterium]|nr:hypothetical protein [Clostridia bacterium]